MTTRALAKHPDKDGERNWIAPAVDVGSDPAVARLKTVPLIHRERMSIIAPVLALISNLQTFDPLVPPYTDAPDGWKLTELRPRMYGATLDAPYSRDDKSLMLLEATWDSICERALFSSTARFFSVPFDNRAFGQSMVGIFHAGTILRRL